MPRVSFTQEFKYRRRHRAFPKLKLDTGEKARLWIPEGRPWMEWKHRIEAPVIEHGETGDGGEGHPRGPIETWKMDWIGNVFCLGETGTPDNPGPLMLLASTRITARRASRRRTRRAWPRRRSGSPPTSSSTRSAAAARTPYELASPVSAEVLIWAYTGRIHGTLYELGSEHGDLRRHDVKLELEDTPAADKYQKIKQLADHREARLQ